MAKGRIKKTTFLTRSDFKLYPIATNGMRLYYLYVVIHTQKWQQTEPNGSFVKFDRHRFLPTIWRLNINHHGHETAFSSADLRGRCRHVHVVHG